MIMKCLKRFKVKKKGNYYTLYESDTLKLKYWIACDSVALNGGNIQLCAVVAKNACI